MSVSIKHVAQQAGVSTATVSHVINETRYVSDEVKQKVYKAMKELDYRPNSVARSLRSRKSMIIGLLVPIMAQDTSNFFFMTVAQGIESVLKTKGYALILSNSNEELETEKEQIKVFNAQLVDGLIIAPTKEEHTYLHDAVQGNYPVIFIDRKPKNYQGDCVLVDGIKGIYEGMKQLIAKGHERIGYISGPLGLTTSDERLEGYNKALTDHGHPVQESLIKVGTSSYEEGYRLAGELISSGVTAILVSNNVMTMGVLDFVQKHQIQIPEQVALIGYDDYKWAEITSPPLSVIRQPAFELGERAAKALLERIEQPQLDYREIRLDASFIQRGSC